MSFNGVFLGAKSQLPQVVPRKLYVKVDLSCLLRQHQIEEANSCYLILPPSGGMRIGSSTGAAGSPPPLTLTNSLTDKTSVLKAANETCDLFFEKRAIKFFITIGFENLPTLFKAFRLTLLGINSLLYSRNTTYVTHQSQKK